MSKEFQELANDKPINELQALGKLLDQADIEFAVLIGSRASGAAKVDSDWDIAVYWDAGCDWISVLDKTESLRREIAAAINVAVDKIDLIELRRANLAMRASAAETGIPLKGADSLSWSRFLTRTWRELEDFYWEQSHAA